MGFHKSQIFFYLLSAFIAGVFINSFELLDTAGLLVSVIIGVAIIAISFKSRSGLLAGFLILAFAAGGTRFNIFNNADDNKLGNLAGREIALAGYVDSEPEVDGNRERFAFRTESGERILVTTNSFPMRKFGDQLEVAGELHLPRNFTDFDYAAYLKKDGIRVTMFYPAIENGELSPGFPENAKIKLYQGIFSLKNKFQDSINKSISEPNAAFVNGILLGTRQNISDDLKDAFSKTGTTHVLAISGYNIMIISEAVLLGLIFFFRRRTAFWISVLVIILFVVLTGASASVVRAAIMGLLLSFARGYGRLYDQRNSIILAGGVMIYHNPFVLVFDVGFQLSFAAVLGLVYLYPRIESRLYKIPELGGIKEISLMTLSVQLAILPLALYYFGGFSPFSFPANILILPFIPAAMFLGFLSGLAGMIFLPIGQILGYGAWAITTYQIWAVDYLSLL